MMQYSVCDGITITQVNVCGFAKIKESMEWFCDVIVNISMTTSVFMNSV